MFYFAWVADGLTTFGVEHEVEDEEIISISIQHNEGDIPSLIIDVKNPREGLLNPGRMTWAWLSWRKPDDTVVPLFHGRLVGVPDDMQDEVIRLMFIARPEDFEDQKEAVADGLRVEPYYDPVFLNSDRLLDPDAALEARPQLWHVGRTDKTVNVSHIIEAEDGNINLGESDFFYEGLSITVGEDPIRRVEVEATVKWTQQAEGVIDLTADLIRAFNEASGYGSTSSIAGHPYITSYTGQGLEASWPLPGDDIGGGWKYDTTTLTLLSGTSLDDEYVEVPIAPGDPDVLDPIIGARFYLWQFAPVYRVAYEAARSRTEVLTFAVDADVQDVLSEASPKVELLKLSSTSVALEVDDPEATGGGTMPIVDLRRKSYFNTDRGKRSLRWLLLLARSRLMFSARSAKVSFALPWDTAVDFSCRKQVTLTDARLPGGEVIGKIIGYSLTVRNGAMQANCTIACSVGNGTTASFSAGNPTYVEDGYVDGYQFYSDAQLDPGTGDLAYDDYDIEVDDDGLDFFSTIPSDFLLGLDVFGGTIEQLAAIQDHDPAFADVSEAVNTLNEHYTYVELNLTPVRGGPFTTNFPIVVSDLAVAKTIDLGA